MIVLVNKWKNRIRARHLGAPRSYPREDAQEVLFEWPNFVMPFQRSLSERSLARLRGLSPSYFPPPYRPGPRTSAMSAQCREISGEAMAGAGDIHRWFQDGHAACRHFSFAPHFRYSSEASSISLPLPPPMARAAGLSTFNHTRRPRDEGRDRGEYVAQTSKRQISCLLLPR